MRITKTTKTPTTKKENSFNENFYEEHLKNIQEVKEALLPKLKEDLKEAKKEVLLNVCKNSKSFDFISCVSENIWVGNNEGQLSIREFVLLEYLLKYAFNEGKKLGKSSVNKG